MYYFAYGSNMLTARLAQRVPEVRPAGPAWLSGHRLHVHLRGGDGSGKCNVLHTGDAADVVHGVLFELDGDRLDDLHAAEGPAYAFLELGVGHAAGEVPAAIYRGHADWLDDALVPYDWYMDFVCHGAREHGLPAAYVAWLESLYCEPDADRERAEHNAAILRHSPDNVRPARRA